MSFIATCQSCGLRFSTPSFIGGPGAATNIVFNNVSVSCPRCGGRAKFQDGVYDYKNGVAEYLAATVRDAASVRDLRRRLEAAQQQAGEAEIRESLAITVPELSSQAQGLPIDRLIALMSLLVAVLTYLQPLFENDQKMVGFTPEQFQQLIEKLDPAQK